MEGEEEEEIIPQLSVQPSIPLSEVSDQSEILPNRKRRISPPVLSAPSPPLQAWKRFRLTSDRAIVGEAYADILPNRTRSANK